jgi:hypothetical protein
MLCFVVGVALAESDTDKTSRKLEFGKILGWDIDVEQLIQHQSKAWAPLHIILYCIQLPLI